MKRKAVPQTKPLREPPVAAEQPSEIDDNSAERVVSRPDGFHWLSPDGRQEFGPFETYEDALADMFAADDDGDGAPRETLQETEDEIGIAGWIDPETGEPAEGQSPPHLQEE